MDQGPDDYYSHPYRTLPYQRTVNFIYSHTYSRIRPCHWPGYQIPEKHSQDVANKYGETLSTLDETLGGLRVIKAFNIEKVLRSKFFKSNEELLYSKIKSATGEILLPLYLK